MRPSAPDEPRTEIREGEIPSPEKIQALEEQARNLIVGIKVGIEDFGDQTDIQNLLSTLEGQRRVIKAFRSAKDFLDEAIRFGGTGALVGMVLFNSPEWLDLHNTLAETLKDAGVATGMLGLSAPFLAEQLRRMKERFSHLQTSLSRGPAEK